MKSYKLLEFPVARNDFSILKAVLSQQLTTAVFGIIKKDSYLITYSEMSEKENSLIRPSVGLPHEIYPSSFITDCYLYIQKTLVSRKKKTNKRHNRDTIYIHIG